MQHVLVSYVIHELILIHESSLFTVDLFVNTFHFLNKTVHLVLLTADAEASIRLAGGQ